MSQTDKFTDVLAEYVRALEHPGDLGHLSNLAFDRLLAGETEGVEPLRAHLAACAHCSQRYAELEAEQSAWQPSAEDIDSLAAAVQASEAAPSQPEQQPKGGARPWWRWALPPLAVAATAAALFLTLRDWESNGTITTRALTLEDLKHGPIVQLLAVDSSGSVRPLETRSAPPHVHLVVDAPVTGNEAIGFRTACTDRCALLLAAVGATGAATVVDSEGASAWQLEPNDWNTLPITIRITPPLLLAGFFCAQAPERSAALAWLEQQYPLPRPESRPDARRDLTAEPQAPAPAGCTVRLVLVSGRRGQ